MADFEIGLIIYYMPSISNIVWIFPQEPAINGSRFVLHVFFVDSLVAAPYTWSHM